MARDLDGLKAALLRDARAVLPAWFPNGRFEGPTFVIGSIDGEAGRSLKVELRTGRWRDWAVGAGGSNLLELYAQAQRLEIVPAYDQLAPTYGLNGAAVAEAVAPKRGPGRPKKEPGRPPDVIEMPVPSEAPPPKFSKPGVTVYEYRDIADQLLFVVYRRDYEEGGKAKKEVRPYVFGTRAGDNRRGWFSQHPRPPKPLYNQPSLPRFPGKAVFLVSGEKCVEALQPKVKNPVLTWAGGDNHITLADWSLLTGRKVLYWPDADESGQATIGVLARELEGVAASVAVLSIPPDVLEQLPEDVRHKADVADLVKAGLLTPELLRRIHEARRPAVSPDPPPPAPEAAPVKPVTPPAAPDPRAPFGPGLPVPLGTVGERIVLLDKRGPQLVYRSAEASGRRALANLADKEDWERSRWAFERRGGNIDVDYDAAFNEYVSACLKLGAMAPDRVRDKGVYLDRGRIVANLAREGLWVDGQIVPMTEIKSRHYYISSGDWVEIREPMRLEDARRIRDLIHSLRWADPFYPVVLAGWLATAPICGAVPWRSNLWLSGQAGSGKSFILHDICKPLLAPVCISTQGSTTEPGIRQALGSRATPVLWDEFEAENQRDKETRNRIMDLVRNSTQGGDPKLFGSPGGGGGQRYYIRTTWLFASVNTQQRLRADERRTLVIELATPSQNPEEREVETQRFRAVERAVRGWDNEIGLSWAWRSVALAKMIDQTRDTIVRLIMRDGTKRSVADQFAALLAGYWSLSSDFSPSEEEAEELLAGTYRRWRESTIAQAATDDNQSDERQLIRTMLDQQVNVTLPDDMGRVQNHRLSLRELVAKAELDVSGARRALSRFGLRLSEDAKQLIIATTHSELSKLMSGTSWVGGWDQVIRRLPGASVTTPRDFDEAGQRVGRRGTAIPLVYCELEEVE